MKALENSGALFIILVAGLLVLYVLPSLIAAIRGTESLGWIIVINLLPSGVGWVAAMVLALGLPRSPLRQPRPAPLVYYPWCHDCPPSPGEPGPYSYPPAEPGRPW